MTVEQVYSSHEYIPDGGKAATSTLGDLDIRPVSLRWLQLVIFALSSMTNNIIWITASPISHEVVNIYKLPGIGWVNYLSAVYFISYVPFMFVASWVLDRKGLRWGITVGVSILTFGCLVRLGGISSDGFWAIALGQTICSTAQPFIQNAPAKLSANWFPDHQRAMATTVGTVAGPVGAAFGLVLPAVLLNLTNTMTAVLVVDAAMAATLLAAVLLWFRSRPPVPPSFSAHEQERAEIAGEARGFAVGEFARSITTLFANKDYVLLFSAYSMNLAAFQALATLINQITSPFDYTSVEASIMGAIVVLSGVVGAAVFSRVIDRFRVYKLALFTSYAATAYFNTLWVLFLYPGYMVALCIISGFFGFFILPCLPVGVALAVEVTYPVPEATPVGFMVMGGQIFSVLFIVIMSQLIEHNLIHTAVMVVGAQAFTSYVITCFLKQRLVRSELDARRQ